MNHVYRRQCTRERSNFNVIFQVRIYFNCISDPIALAEVCAPWVLLVFSSVSLLGEKARRLHWRPSLLNMMLTLFHSIYSSQEVFLMPSCRTHTHCRFCLPPNPPSSVFPPSTMGNNYLRDLLKQNKDIQNNKF